MIVSFLSSVTKETSKGPKLTIRGEALSQYHPRVLIPAR